MPTWLQALPPHSYCEKLTQSWQKIRTILHPEISCEQYSLWKAWNTCWLTYIKGTTCIPYLYKVVNITILTYFMCPQIIPSFLRLKGYCNFWFKRQLQSWSNELLSHYFWELLNSGIDFIIFMMNCWMSFNLAWYKNCGHQDFLYPYIVNIIA